MKGPNYFKPNINKVLKWFLKYFISPIKNIFR
jgi:hypothetical protein